MMLIAYLPKDAPYRVTTGHNFGGAGFSVDNWSYMLQGVPAIMLTKEFRIGSESETS
jgi:hypothetical protein